MSETDHLPAAGRSHRRAVGRRPGVNDTRGDILSASRRQFASGYTAATIRKIAADAGVDPALVIQYFGSKADLFLAAIESVMKPTLIVQALGQDDGRTVGTRLAEQFFSLWEADESRYPLQSILLSAASHPPAAQLFRQFITAQVISPVARLLDVNHAELRASLCGSQLVGAALVRYVYQMPEMATLDHGTLVRVVSPTLDAYLSGPLARVRRKRA